MHVRPDRLEGLPICKKGNELWDTLRKRILECFEGSLKLVKACLHQRRYPQPALCAQQVLSDRIDGHTGSDTDFTMR
jgi:hypothetical protein